MKTKFSKFILLLMVPALIVFFTSCGKNSEKSETTDEIETVAQIADEKVATEEPIVEESENDIEETYTENEYGFLLDGAGNGGKQIDLLEFESTNKVGTLIRSINIYFTDTSFAGYTKIDIPIDIISENDEWSFCSLGTDGYLVKNTDLVDAVEYDASLEGEIEEQENVYDEEESPKTDIEQTIHESVQETPAETPVPVQSNKYTPEEAVAVYRSAMEAGGITWNPSLKGVSSWGTGWIYLEKGMPEWTASTDLESFSMGDSAGNPWTQYYLEVTSSDDEAVYITAWHN